jgi:hypothetical protein
MTTDGSYWDSDSLRVTQSGHRPGFTGTAPEASRRQPISENDEVQACALTECRS